MVRKKNTSGLSVTDQDKRHAVQDLLERKMRNTYNADERQMAKELWQDFCEVAKPKIRSVQAYAAAIDYTIGQIEGRSHWTQNKAAKRYHTTQGSVARIYRKIVEVLDLSTETPDASAHHARPLHTDASPHGQEERLEQLLGRERLSALQQFLDQQFDDEVSPLHKDHQPLVLSIQQQQLLRALPPSDESWSGGRRTLKTYVLEPIPIRPDIAIWVHSTGHPVVGQTVLEPHQGPQALLDSLLQAMQSPSLGPPRRPKQILLADPMLAPRFAKLLSGFDIQVQHGAEDAVQALVTLLEASFANQATQSPPTYLNKGRVSEETVSSFFHASADLYMSTPWRYAHDSQVLSVDLSNWGEALYTVSVIGSQDIEYGLLLFRSFDDYMAFSHVSQLAEMFGQAPRGPQVDILSVTFERGANLPAPLRREVLQHGWKVAHANAYPSLLYIDKDNIARPLSTQDYEVATVCANAVEQFMKKHKGLFDRTRPKQPKALEFTPENFAERGSITVMAPHPDVYL